MSAHTFFFQLIKGEKKGFLFSCLRGVLYLLSMIYLVGNNLHKLLYKLKIKKSYRPKIYTISVGNITAGGTGKTPVTIFLGERLSKICQVAILLRGYKSKVSLDKPLSSNETKDPDYLGDEAALIASKLPQVEVISCIQRKKGAQLAESHGAKIILLDDGMQHYAIKRDVEIVVLDGYNPFGYGYLLPRGLLRESLKGLKRADLIVINRSSLVSDINEIVSKIRLYNKSASIIQTEYKVLGYYDLEGNSYNIPPQTKVSIFCAIGNPHSFLKLVQKDRLIVKSTIYLQDHASFKEDELQKFSEQAKNQGVSYLITTEKDAIKIKKGLTVSIPILVMKVDLEINDGEDLLNARIKNWEDVISN